LIFLGVLALLQILFLPGLLISRWVRLGGGFLQKTIQIVGISFIVNFVLVFLFTALHIYIQPVMLILLVGEIGVLLFVYRGVLKVPVSHGLSQTWDKIAGAIIKVLHPEDPQNNSNSIYQLFRRFALLIAFFFAVTAIIHMGRIIISNVPSVFNTYDAIVSWNRWGTNWASNVIPSGTEDYPQLGPVMFSLTYVFLGSVEVQFFAKALMPIFLFLVMLMFFDLGMEKPSFGILLGVEIVYLVVKHFVGEYITDGYMDIPLAFFAFLSIYILLKSRQEKNDKQKVLVVLLGFIFAGGAALTKQAGIYILVVYPFLAVAIHGWEKIKKWFREYRWVVLAGLVILIIVVVPWYGFKAIQIHSGSETSHLMIPVENTSSKFGTLSIMDKISSGLLSTGKYALGFLVLIPALFIIDPAIRWIIILIVFPFTILWAGYASYDVRNVTLVWPFYSLAIAVSLEAYLERFFKLGERVFGNHRLRWWGVAILIVVALAVISTAVPSNILIQKQVSLQKQILNPELNQQLYDYFEANPSQGKILTNYPIGFLPGFEGRDTRFGFNNLPDFEWALDQGNIGFLLVPNYAVDEVRARIKNGVKSGEFTLVFTNDKYVPEEFYIVNR
jgi:hypothetical protein